jgi:three-Cys-motif partner protein
MLSMAEQSFGGQWTADKLNRVRKYLIAYRTIFTANSWARRYKTIYVDAFAGCGYSRGINDRARLDDNLSLFAELEEPDSRGLKEGSPRVALSLPSPFDQYVFVERKKTHAASLRAMVAQEFVHLNAKVHAEEANAFLQQWCTSVDWRDHRCVMFLDPYGMEVSWEMISVIARTQAIDMWLLFPLGQGVNRLLTRNAPPEGSWAERLTNMLGTSAWKEEFYRGAPQQSLFDENDQIEKHASWDAIESFFVSRLESVFSKVARPRRLYNSRNIPLYLLCFAAGNPRGAPTALSIANHILKADPP